MERKPSPADEVLAQAAVRAAETDSVLSELDAVLDADPLYQQICAELDRRKSRYRRLGWRTAQGEVLRRMLLVAYLYDWSTQETSEQVQDSLVLRWFCRLGLQPAPPESHVSQATDQVSVAVLESLVNRVEQARERAKKSEGRLRPTYRQRWR